MQLIIALVLAWTITPILLYLVNKKGLKLSANMPAWVITVIVCIVVAVIVNAVTGAFAWRPFDFFALVAIVYFGANSFFNLVVKPYFPGAAGPSRP
jgi:hypothetical protein